MQTLTFKSTELSNMDKEHQINSPKERKGQKKKEKAQQIENTKEDVEIIFLNTSKHNKYKKRVTD